MSFEEEKGKMISTEKKGKLGRKKKLSYPSSLLFHTNVCTYDLS